MDKKSGHSTFFLGLVIGVIVGGSISYLTLKSQAHSPDREPKSLGAPLLQPPISERHEKPEAMSKANKTAVRDRPDINAPTIKSIKTED